MSTIVAEQFEISAHDSLPGLPDYNLDCQVIARRRLTLRVGARVQIIKNQYCTSLLTGDEVKIENGDTGEISFIGLMQHNCEIHLVLDKNDMEVSVYPQRNEYFLPNPPNAGPNHHTAVVTRCQFAFILDYCRYLFYSVL